MASLVLGVVGARAAKFIIYGRKLLLLGAGNSLARLGIKTMENLADIQALAPLAAARYRRAGHWGPLQ